MFKQILRKVKLLIGFTILLVIILNTVEFISADNKPTSPNFNYNNIWFALDSMTIDEVIDNKTDTSKFHKIKITNQQEFDNINSTIKTNIDSGNKDLLISFNPGRYEFSENHIQLSLSTPNVNLIFDGNGSEIIGKTFPITDEKNPAYTYSKDGMIIDPWSKTIQLDEKIIDTQDHHIYKVKKPDFQVKIGDFIKVSQWFISSVYRITDIKDAYLYFSSDYPFVTNRKNWNVNYDLTYGKEYPRYRIFDASSDISIMEHRSISFLNVTNSKLKSLKICNFNYLGSAQSSEKALINFTNYESQNTIIKDCHFSDCKSMCITLKKTSNIKIEHCDFQDNYNSSIWTNDECYGTQIISNFFCNNGKDWNNYFDITVSGDRFLVANNIVVNFHYGGIRVGDWWGQQKKGRVEGIVEYNNLFYTPDFLNKYKDFTLMDSGAIYVATVNDNVHIRYNRIYDIIGMKDYRGIFCDDGTCNTKIYGNIITGIGNCYSIDLRYTPKIEEKENYTFGKVNVGNVLIYNFVDGDIRFEGRERENESVKGRNYLLKINHNKVSKVYTRNLETQEKDSLLTIKNKKNDIIILSKRDKQKLKKDPIYSKIIKWIK